METRRMRTHHKRRYGQSLAQRLYRLLRTTDGMRPGDVRRALGIREAQATHAMARLVEDGIARRIWGERRNWTVLWALCIDAKPPHDMRGENSSRTQFKVKRPPTYKSHPLEQSWGWGCEKNVVAILNLRDTEGNDVIAGGTVRPKKAA